MGCHVSLSRNMLTLLGFVQRVNSVELYIFGSSRSLPMRPPQGRCQGTLSGTLASRQPSCVEPLQRVILGKNGPECLASARLFLLFCVNTVQFGLVVGTSCESSEMDVRWAGLGHGWDAHLSEQVNAIRRHGHAYLVEVIDTEPCELRIAEMLDSGEVFGLMLCAEACHQHNA